MHKNKRFITKQNNNLKHEAGIYTVINVTRNTLVKHLEI